MKQPLLLYHRQGAIKPGVGIGRSNLTSGNRPLAPAGVVGELPHPVPAGEPGRLRLSSDAVGDRAGPAPSDQTSVPRHQTKGARDVLVVLQLPPEPLGCPIDPPRGKGHRLARDRATAEVNELLHESAVAGRGNAGAEAGGIVRGATRRGATEAEREETKGALRNLGRGRMTSARGRASWQYGTRRSPPALLDSIARPA
jgi:hypothetical protein